MDAKDLRTNSGVSDQNNGCTKYAQSSATSLHCDRNKSYQDIGSNTLGKMDGPNARPCAVIGPDRIVPPPATSDTYLKKNPVEPWPCADSIYRRPPDYPHNKLANFQSPSRNISPRQTFQENMQRIMVPPTYSSVKINDDATYTQIPERSSTHSKNIKLNVPPDAKFCDVPYAINPTSNEPKNFRNSEMCLPSVNPVPRTPTNGWPMGSANLRSSRAYGAPEMYQYPDYPSCAGPRPTLTRPHRAGPEEPSYLYGEPYYPEGNIRFKPYPSVKERYPQQRYDYVSNYSNSFHPPPNFPNHKYDLPKSVAPSQYPPPYPTIKYLDNRIPDSVIEGFQRNPQGSYPLPYRNQIVHHNYGPVIGNCAQNKIQPYPQDPHQKNVAPNKITYENNAKTYVEYENSRPKIFPPSDGYFINEMSRMHPIKNQVIVPNYPSLSMHNVPPQYFKKDSQQMKNYEYMAHYRAMDPNLNIHNAMSRHPPVFSPNSLAISPPDSNASNDIAHTLVAAQENFGYVSQSSTASIRNMESNRLANDYYRKYYDPRYTTISRPAVIGKGETNAGSKDKKNINVRQFLQMWNEGDDEGEDSPKEVKIQNVTNDINYKRAHEALNKQQEQLYVLGLVNVPSEELGKYEHVQKISKLPENIKGYNDIELLNQFEQAIESSKLTNYKPPTPKDFHMSMKTQHQMMSKPFTGVVPPRPVSPLDVESKISQSVIHKEVGCNFEIKPCSPKMLNVEIAAPVQSMMEERSIEKVMNTVMIKSPLISEKIDNSSIKQQDHILSINENHRIQSCNMIGNHFAHNSPSPTIKTGYSMQDLESNSGLCLASLPQLDNDIELNFPEVNQQFINANKADSRVVTPMKDLPTLEEITNPLVKTVKEDYLNVKSVSQDDVRSPISPYFESGTEFTKLSKYRKSRINIAEQKENEIHANNIRTDSVIIKNPDSVKNYEDISNLDDSLNLRQDPQQAPINLTSYSNNVKSAEKEIESSVTNIIVDESRDKELLDMAIDFSVNKNNVNDVKSDRNIDAEREPAIEDESASDCIKDQNDNKSLLSEQEHKELDNGMDLTEVCTTNNNAIADGISKNDDAKSKNQFLECEKNEADSHISIKQDIVSVSDEIILNSPSEVLYADTDINHSCDDRNTEEQGEIEQELPIASNEECYQPSPKLRYISEEKDEKNISEIETANYDVELAAYKNKFNPDSNNYDKDGGLPEVTTALLDSSQVIVNIQQESIEPSETYEDESKYEKYLDSPNPERTLAIETIELATYKNKLNPDSNNYDKYVLPAVTTTLLDSSQVNIQQESIEPSETYEKCVDSPNPKRNHAIETIELATYKNKSNPDSNNYDKDVLPAVTIAYLDSSQVNIQKESIEPSETYEDEAKCEKCIDSPNSERLLAIETINGLKLEQRIGDELNKIEDGFFVISPTVKEICVISPTENEEVSVISPIEKDDQRVDNGSLFSENTLPKSITPKKSVPRYLYYVSKELYSPIIQNLITSIEGYICCIPCSDIEASENTFIEASEAFTNENSPKPEYTALMLINNDSTKNENTALVKSTSDEIEREVNETNKEDSMFVNSHEIIIDDPKCLDKTADSPPATLESNGDIEENTSDKGSVHIYTEDKLPDVDGTFEYSSDLEDNTFLNNIEKSSYINRRLLKRSLSESALSTYNIQTEKQNEESADSVWPYKRRKNNNDIFAQKFCNIINNNRRNSVSALYTEENVSFCIFIDNSCIITEEETESQDKECCNELSEDCFVDLQNDASSEKEPESSMLPETEVNSQPELGVYQYDSLTLGYDEEKSIEQSWVENVACMETIMSDDIAEDIEICNTPSPGDDALSETEESEVLSANDHTDKVKFIYGDNLCSGDAQLVDTLFNTPQMNVDKTLNRETSFSENSDKCYDSDSLEQVLSATNEPKRISPCSASGFSDVSRAHPLTKITKDDVELLQSEDILNGSPERNLDKPEILTSDTVNFVRNIFGITQDDTVHSCESSIDNVFSYTQKDEDTSYTSSSPEVSSTTSEEKSSSILLKITNYNGSMISQINNNSITDQNRPSCKFTEDKEYSHSHYSANRPLLTKAAQKYIPPLKESIRDLKVKLSLPSHSLLKLKQLKLSKAELKDKKLVPTISKSLKKPKPKFEDVLKSIDEIQFKMHKEKNKKSKKTIPKVVIKKSINGSHYASTSSKVEFNPDMTGRKWQPWVFIEKNHFIDRMAIKNKTKAIFSHRKNTYVLAENFRKYKSVLNANFVMTPPITDRPSGLKYTIRLKHY